MSRRHSTDIGPLISSHQRMIQPKTKRATQILEENTVFTAPFRHLGLLQSKQLHALPERFPQNGEPVSTSSK